MMKRILSIALFALAAVTSPAWAQWPPANFWQPELTAVPVLTSSGTISIEQPNVVAACPQGCTLSLPPCFASQSYLVFNGTQYNGSTNGVATFTGTAGSGAQANQLTVTGAVEPIYIGEVISQANQVDGTGPTEIPTGTVITAQLSGPTGSNGVYQTSVPTTANAAGIVAGAVTIQPSGSDVWLNTWIVGSSGPYWPGVTVTTRLLAVGMPGNSPSCAWAIANF